VAATGRKAGDSARTRAAILDAAEGVMRDDGYAAVTTRRVSERAGVNLGLIHYHFVTMGELFLGLFQRTDDQHLARYDHVLGAEHPLRALWEVYSDATLSRILADVGVDAGRWPPLVLSLLMAGASRAIATETAIGVHAGHAEALAFIDGHLRDLEPGASASG
jgi:AcrR family transcriptional regulator